MEINSYFPTPILNHTLDEKVANNIEEKIVSKLSLLTKVENHTQFNDFKLKSPLFSPSDEPILRIEIERSIDFYISELVLPEISEASFWVENYSPLCYNPRHNNQSSKISGVYFIRANQDAGKILFFTPNPYEQKPHHPNSIFPNTIEITPKKGLLLIFPSYIEYQIIKGNSNCIQTNLSFNFK